MDSSWALSSCLDRRPPRERSARVPNRTGSHREWPVWLPAKRDPAGGRSPSRGKGFRAIGRPEPAPPKTPRSATPRIGDGNSDADPATLHPIAHANMGSESIFRFFIRLSPPHRKIDSDPIFRRVNRADEGRTQSGRSMHVSVDFLFAKTNYYHYYSYTRTMRARARQVRDRLVFSRPGGSGGTWGRDGHPGRDRPRHRGHRHRVGGGRGNPCRLRNRPLRCTRERC